MTIPELQYRIALTMIPSVGPVTARTLINSYGSAQAVFNADREELGQIKRIGALIQKYTRRSTLMERAGEELEFLRNHRIDAHFFMDPAFPQKLNECKDGPFLLYARGSQDLNPEKSLSVVGTRRASAYGKELCRELITGLADRIPDVVIVSGLAYGIDVTAHRAALESGLPTVAVLGHGLSTIYPSLHRDTAKMILNHGALVTDFDSGMGPERNNFLRRNRIIAGMTDATLVIESAETGGALVTASQAFSYDRTVLAVPGRTKDSRSVGCNNLIKRNMAALVTSPEDILTQAGWNEEKSPASPQGPRVELSGEEEKILTAINDIPDITPGDLGDLIHIPVHQVLALLLEMELKGWITAEPGNRYKSMILLG